MFAAFWGEQQAAVAIVAAACIFLEAGDTTFDCPSPKPRRLAAVEGKRRPRDDYHFSSLMMLP